MFMNAYSKDRNGIYVAVNPDFMAFSQLSEEALIGKNDNELIWAQSAVQIMENDAQVMQSGKSKVYIEQPIIKGKIFPRRCFKSPMLSRHSKIIGMMGTSVALDPRVMIPLTPQQTACLKALALGASIKKIAKELGLSPRTVEHYLATLKDKLNCKTRSELIMLAFARGLIGGFNPSSY